MERFYSNFEFGFDEIAWNETTDDIIANVFIDTVKPLTGEFERIYIDNQTIKDFMISCCFEELKQHYISLNPSVQLKLTEERLKNERLQDDRH